MKVEWPVKGPAELKASSEDVQRMEYVVSMQATGCRQSRTAAQLMTSRHCNWR